MAIHVVGGVYHEQCVHPHWNRIYGSAGRAALAIGHFGTPVALHSYMSCATREAIAEEAAWLSDAQMVSVDVSTSPAFRYMHDLDRPEINGVPRMAHEPIRLTEEKVLRFDMLEGDAIVRASWAVYDPQGAGAPRSFASNGSAARHLALVLNTWEAGMMAGLPEASPSVAAPRIAHQHGAEVVVIKRGPLGAFVWTPYHEKHIPAYRTSHVWKIGSGDCFAAHFANAWMHERMPPIEAADRASLATAYYCEQRALPTKPQLANYSRAPVEASERVQHGGRPRVYLAGPFFDLSQLWMVEEARRDLREAGLEVFSPYHDVGFGSASQVVEKDLLAIRDSDVLFAITDGLDAGTLYEIGYARALGKPVIVYSERHADENLKMMEGSGCVMCNSYATAVYSALWEAANT